MKKYFVILLSMLFLSSPIYSEMIQQQEPSLTVKVENKLFSPSTKIIEGVIFFPKVEGVKKIRFWSLDIINEKNKIVREVKGKDELPEKIVWDGLSDKGQQADDGQYSYKFNVQALRIKLHEEGAGITLDSIPPFVSLKCGDVYFVDQDANKFTRDINIYLSCGDENGIDYEKSYVRVVNYNDVEVKRFTFKDSIPEFISWNGIDDVYGNILPTGNYKISFVATDKAGNMAQVDSDISVVFSPKEPAAQEAPASLQEQSQAEQTQSGQPQTEQSQVGQPQEESSKQVKAAESQVSVKEDERGLVINLSSKVLFDISKSAIKPEAEQSLNEVAGILKVYPVNKVLIEGYTDSSGKEKANMQLSVDRAKSVYDFLVAKGVDGTRMQTFGYGDKKPVASNETERGREQNRRVEIIILKAGQDTATVQSASSTTSAVSTQSVSGLVTSTWTAPVSAAVRQSSKTESSINSRNQSNQPPQAGSK